jgi:hypothetical protein
MLNIQNDGARILATNFFETEQAKAGKFFVSVNAGALRLLIPAAHVQIVEEIEKAEYAILSRGPWPAEGQAEAVEILFEDHSDSPFALHLSRSSFDMLPAKPQAGKHWRLTAWVEGPRQVGDWLCHWRRVAQIPWLKPL